MQNRSTKEGPFWVIGKSDLQTNDQTKSQVINSELTTEAVLNLGWWRRKTKAQLAQVESRAGGDHFDN